MEGRVIVAAGETIWRLMNVPKSGTSKGRGGAARSGQVRVLYEILAPLQLLWPSASQPSADPFL